LEWLRDAPRLRDVERERLDHGVDRRWIGSASEKQDQQRRLHGTSVTHSATTVVSVGGFAGRTTSIFCAPGPWQFAGSATTRQHGVVALASQAGSGCSTAFGLPACCTSDTAQSIGCASTPSRHDDARWAWGSIASPVIAPDRSSWQIDEDVLRFGNSFAN